MACTGTTWYLTFNKTRSIKNYEESYKLYIYIYIYIYMLLKTILGTLIATSSVFIIYSPVIQD
jgi:hypothetical protein